MPDGMLVKQKAHFFRLLGMTLQNMKYRVVPRSASGVIPNLWAKEITFEVTNEW